MIRLWRCLSVLVACVVVAACVTPARMAGSPEALETFARAGRFALTVTEAGGGQDAVQGGFSWLDERDRYVLDLTNPLGSTQARVEGRPGAAVLTRANGEQLRASDPDSLAEEALGSRIPVAGLRDWFQGRVAAQPPASGLASDAQGRPLAFEQGGWQAKLSRYDEQGPQLLVLERREAGRRIVLRLVVDPA